MPEPSSSLTLMPAGHIRRTVRRMAMQIAEDFNSGEQVLLVGINTRGNHFARLLREALLHTGIAETGLINLNVHDMELAGAVGAGELSTASHFLLIDDVLFSGSTMMQALRFVLDHATPKVIKMAVLVDRGHRMFPIQPDYAGIVSPTKFNEHVRVSFQEDGTPAAVMLQV